MAEHVDWNDHLWHNTKVSFLLTCIVRAASGENLFKPYANNKDADQPAHQRNLISAFVVRCLDSIKSLLAIAEISRL